MAKCKFLAVPVLLLFLLVPALAAEKLNIGPDLPPFTLEAPPSPEAQKYLGLEKMEPFVLSKVQG